MRKLLNTLFITTQGAYLSKQGETVKISHEKKVLLQIPFVALESVVCFGRVSCSPALLGALAQAGISTTFLSQSGRFLAIVKGFTSGNVLLRRQQFRIADIPEKSTEIARNIVLAKISNARSVLVRAARDTNDSELDRNKTLKMQSERLLTTFINIRACNDVNKLRGYEGEAASQYFVAMNALQTKTPTDSDFLFTKRTRRPPLDRINALLSFVYTLLLQDCRAALESVGLDPCVGFLHEDNPGKPSLALDLMEEFRAPIADRLVISLINRRQVQPSGFTVRDNGAVIMDAETRKIVITAWQSRKRDEIQHPFTLENISIGLLPYMQALLLARYIRGDLDAYPPFIAKT
jgi:CRISPR-associated protein Cas1